MDKTAVKILFAMILLMPMYTYPSGLSKSLRVSVDKDTVRNVWVYFKDRPARESALPVSERAALRRLRAGYRAGDADRPVHQAYIKEIERRGARLRHTFAWENAASFSVHSSQLEEIAALPFVKSVTPVAVYVRKDAAGAGVFKAAARSAAQGDDGYGWHMELVSIPLAHEYIKIKGLGDPGSGILAAFFDSGFRLNHRAFAYARSARAVVAAYDFVDRDTTVAAPDSVNNNPSHRYYRNDRHGTQCLGLAAGYHPDNYIGAAWGARFALARTEDHAVETHAEEDNWAAAVLWAENLGAAIISSSLGYRDGFDSLNAGYEYRDMDGATTIVSKAAAGAVARGIIVVNAMGNEGNSPGSIVAPADVDGVVAVGAVGETGWLATFSSFGPTSDGRIKPDAVAPGVTVPLIDPYPSNLASYTTGNGTSFAAPIVSGIMALILQTHPGISPDSARARLYRFCEPAGNQSERDNGHGYGIPNALRAVMRDDEIFFKITDSAGIPLQGAQVRAGTGTYFANESGAVLFKAPAAMPIHLKITYRDDTLDTVTVSAADLPFAMSVAMPLNIKDNSIKARPTIANRNGPVRGRYYFPVTNTQPGNVTAVVRSVNGKTVWKTQSLEMRPDGTVDFLWDGKNAKGIKIPAGIYLLTVRHGGNTINQKFVVAN